ncbi:MAG: hypothetical protein Q8O67_05065 [Deltaproteobacteria bacterium]|nr:hypothetical protein [Deltaproteobacteria bacterium]
MRVALFLLLALLTSTSAFAQGKNARMLCGCASSRFLTRGAVTLDANTSLGAWIHGETHIDGFTKDEKGKLTTSTTLPFSVHEFSVDNATPGAARLVQVTASGAGSGWLGMVRPGDLSPKDVVTVTFAGAGGASKVGAGPQLTALWLAPVEERERKDCGPWITARLAFELKEGSPAVDGFLIRDGRTGRQSLVDARHAGAFGIGRVDVCDHGFEIEDTELIEIVPLSSSWGRGDPWSYALDMNGERDPRRIASPKSADEDLLDTAFPVPGTPTKPYSMMSVGGMWTLSAAGGLLCGAIGFLFWRFKRRRMETITCASCHAKIPVDVLDEKTDGFFCPACGTAGLWKGKGRVDVDVTRL